MTPEFVVTYCKGSIELLLSIILPILLVGLGIGVILSIIQAATQIQEQTLTFVPKILTIFTMLIITFPLIMDKLIAHTTNVFLNLPQYIK